MFMSLLMALQTTRLHHTFSNHPRIFLTVQGRQHIPPISTIRISSIFKFSLYSSMTLMPDITAFCLDSNVWAFAPTVMFLVKTFTSHIRYVLEFDTQLWFQLLLGGIMIVKVVAILPPVLEMWIKFSVSSFGVTIFQSPSVPVTECPSHWKVNRKMGTLFVLSVFLHDCLSNSLSVLPSATWILN